MYQGSHLTDIPSGDYYPETGNSRHSRELAIVGGRSRPTPQISFEDALRELFELLKQTLRFYSAFQQRFEEETRDIVAYASKQVLDGLWQCRVSYHEQRQSSCSNKDKSDQDNVHNPNQRHPQSVQTFKSTQKQLRNALAAVVEEPISRGAQHSKRGEGLDEETYRRLNTKINTVGREIMASAAHAGKKIGEVKALLTEMELLKTYLENYKEVWQGQKRDRGHGEGQEEERGGARVDHEEEGRWGGSEGRDDSQCGDDNEQYQ
jgi:hypothetical protein